MKTWLVALSVCALAACSSDDEDTSPEAIEAPMLMTVEPMDGALHLVWMNMAEDADSVEAERKMDDGPFEPAFSVPGTVDNRMDGTATDDMPYTYRLRAKKGALFSEYSEQMTANPTDVP
jgi:hypothetical protein